MASVNQLVSDIAHSIKQADNVPTRKALRLNIINARAQLIRQQFNNHHYIDEGLCQELEFDISQKSNIIDIPKPIRLDNNTPFLTVSISGKNTNKVSIPFIKSVMSNYYNNLPGMNKMTSYSYHNDQIIINNLPNGFNKLVVNSVFEQPVVASLDSELLIDDNYVNFISEDMVGQLKKLILEVFNPNIIRDTNEPNPLELVK